MIFCLFFDKKSLFKNEEILKYLFDKVNYKKGKSGRMYIKGKGMINSD